MGLFHEKQGGLIHNHICEILLVLLLAYFLGTKDMSNCYDKTIMVDGFGYYAYLPATYIYHDYSYKFFDEIYSKYYCPGFTPPTKYFVNQFDGLKINKYYPGVSLLWLPFFLLAHLLAGWLHLPTDGYSNIYQYAIGIAGLFYTYLGLKFTKRILNHYGILPIIQTITLTLILFGTNMLLYAAVWSSQTHAYSFFLIAAFCWFCLQATGIENRDIGSAMASQYKQKNESSYALSMCFVFLALIVSVRPQNVAILTLLPFLGLSKLNFKDILKNIFTPLSIAGIFVGLIIVGRVIYYWHLQTGRFFLNPYHGEHFYFTESHFFDTLFSFRKGWILYSPFIAFGLAGIFFFKRSVDKINLLLFWVTFIFISSCWWCWTYSSISFGQRIYVDFYCLIALQAAVFFDAIYKGKTQVDSNWFTKRYIVPMLAAFIFIPLCLLQTVQYKKAIIDGDAATKETYFKYFFETKPVAFYSIPSQTINDSTQLFFNFDNGNSDSRTSSTFYSGPNSTFICNTKPYSETFRIPLPHFMRSDLCSNIRVTAKIKCNPDSVEGQALVIDIRRNNEPISYNSFFLSGFIHNNKWTEFQRGFTSISGEAPGDTATIYFWKSSPKGTDTTFIDDLRIEFVHTDSSYIFKM